MGVVVLGLAIAELVTSFRANTYKSQINALIRKHRAIQFKINRIMKDLELLDFKQTNQKLSKMSQKIFKNMNAIMEDQLIKLDLFNKLGLKRTLFEPSDILKNLGEAANTIGIVGQMIYLECSDSPVAKAITGTMLGISSVLNIFLLIRNMKEIDQLKQRKAELEQYFKPGGQFEQNMIKISDRAFEVVENFYYFVVNFRSMMNQLRVCLHLVSLSKNSKIRDFQPYFQLINQNPFDDAFEKECRLIYRYFLAIQDLTLDRKTIVSCQFIEDFERDSQVLKKLSAVKKIAVTLSDDSEMMKQFDDSVALFTKLTNQKVQFAPDFAQRKLKTPVALAKSDKTLLSSIENALINQPEKQLAVAQVVSFYTDHFYADDPTGQTLYNLNLKDIFEATDLMVHMGLDQLGSNVIYLPEPDDETLKAEWLKVKQNLEAEYAKKNPDIKFVTKKVYIQINSSSFVSNNEKNYKLDYSYGLLVANSKSSIDQKFIVQIQEHQQLPVEITRFAQLTSQYYSLDELCNMVWVNMDINPAKRVLAMRIICTGDYLMGRLQILKISNHSQPRHKVQYQLIGGELTYEQFTRQNIIFELYVQELNTSVVFYAGYWPSA